MIYDTRRVPARKTEANASTISLKPSLRSALLCLIVALCALRLTHVHLLWADEDYHLAAALQIIRGKLPYRDFFYDKPPLGALFYVLIGAHPGWPLRLLDTAYTLVACWLAYKLAQAWWGATEAWVAALLLAFFTAFYLPAAVIPFAPDALMLVPHLAAVFFAVRKLAFWSGVWVGVAFLINAKAVFIGAVCLLWLWPAAVPLLLGFAAPVIVAGLAAFALGAWPGYIEQVWHWGLLYARASQVSRPVWNAIVRTADWLLFHAALVAGAVFGFSRGPRGEHLKLGAWLLLSFMAVVLGLRFVPRYFFQLLPAAVIIASRGIVLALNTRRQFAAVALALLLAAPVCRFGPRYVTLAYGNFFGRIPLWSDAALDLDSQAVAARLRSLVRPTDTLFVWGYRPDIYVFARMTPAERFWDSQPLTGVPADRHLYSTKTIDVQASANRLELVRSSPDWIVDGLGLLNPRLAPAAYPELRAWLAGYRLVARTKLSLIYRKNK